MSFKDAVVTCFKKYVDFSGRARRSEYWYFALFTGIVEFVLGLICRDIPIIISLFSLATMLPTLAVTWRRLHDVNKCGAWVFISLVPIVGWILLLVWSCKDSNPGENRFGPCPK